MKKRTLFFIIPILLLSSCTTVKVIKKMYAEEATVEWWQTSNKELAFIPMVHVGKPEFYESVKANIESLKEKGFIVYYEGSWMKSPEDSVAEKIFNWVQENKFHQYYYNNSPNKDSIARDIYRRKLRRIMGIAVDSSGYINALHEKGIFKSMVGQPRGAGLGFSNTDVNVDITINEIVEVYEKLYGTVSLAQIDLAIPLKMKEGYPKSLRLSRDKAFSVLIDYRNHNLADFIQQSPHQKIIVVYGDAHKKGVLEQLQQMDGSWKKKG